MSETRPSHAGKGAAWSGERTSRAPLWRVSAGRVSGCGGLGPATRAPAGRRGAAVLPPIGRVWVNWRRLASQKGGGWTAGGFGGCAHARRPGPCPDRKRSRLPQVSSRAAGPLPSPGVPERLCGPDEGRLAGGERDPPSVRKPSLAIREVCLGVPDPPARRLSLCCGSAAVATRLQRTLLLRCPRLDGMRWGDSEGSAGPRGGGRARGSSSTVARASPFRVGGGSRWAGPDVLADGKAAASGGCAWHSVWRATPLSAVSRLSARSRAEPRPLPMTAFAWRGVWGRLVLGKRAVPTGRRAGLPERDRVRDGRETGDMWPLVLGLWLRLLWGRRWRDPGLVRGLLGGLPKGRSASQAGRCGTALVSVAVGSRGRVFLVARPRLRVACPS